MSSVRISQRLFLFVSFCLGVVLGIFRLIVDLTDLEPLVELYRQGSVLAPILKVLYFVCIAFALLSGLIAGKESGLKFRNRGTLQTFLALLLALLILAYVVTLFVTQLNSGFATVKTLFGKTSEANASAPADSLSVLLLFFVSLPVSAYYFICFLGKKKTDLRAGLSVFPILFYILVVIHTYFESSAALNSEPKVMLLLALVGCLLFAVEEARSVIEIPRKWTLLSFSALLMVCAIPEGLSSLVMNLTGKLSSECGLILPCIMIAYPLYAFFSLMRTPDVARQAEQPAAAPEQAKTDFK